MKFCFITLLALLSFCSCSTLSKDDSTPNGVVVKVLTQPLPKDAAKKQAWLADVCKADEERFGSYSNRNWQTNYAAFARALFQKAEALKLNAASLRSSLELILQDAHKEAYLPVAAYQTSLEGELVWIVTVKWEHALWFGNERVPLSHIRAYAFDQKTLKEVGFTTCM